MYKWKRITPDELIVKLANFKESWWFVGGYGLDLWFGKITREHGDIDISIFRESLPALFELDFDFYLASKGELKQISSLSDLSSEDWNIWIKHKYDEDYLFQCLIADSVDNFWVYRRNSKIKLRSEKYGCITNSGYHVIKPEIQLLYKSASDEEKDERDFQLFKNHLHVKARSFLKNSLDTVYEGKHRWIGQL